MPWLDDVERLEREKDALKDEVERLRANIDIWQKTAEDALDEAGRLRATNRTNIDIHDEVDRLRAERPVCTFAGLHSQVEELQREVERLRARQDYWPEMVRLEREVERLRDKLKYAELYRDNYEAMYKSACVRARLYGDPTPLP